MHIYKTFERFLECPLLKIHTHIHTQTRTHTTHAPTQTYTHWHTHTHIQGFIFLCFCFIWIFHVVHWLGFSHLTFLWWDKTIDRSFHRASVSSICSFIMYVMQQNTYMSPSSNSLKSDYVAIELIYTNKTLR